MGVRAPRILMAAGGTGGHVYPALAIADAISAREPNAVIEFAGTRDRMEWEAVPKGGYAIHPIVAAGISRTHLVRNLTLPLSLGRGMTQALRLVGDYDADVVLGTGGYVTGPVGLAAAMRGRPLVIQEQNAHAGVTNRMLGRVATRVHVAFPEARAAFSAKKCVLSGNPVRPGIGKADSAEARTHFGIVTGGASVLLVLGGSLGSQAMNEIIADRIVELMAGNPALHVIWQTGPRYFERMLERVHEVERVHLVRYIDRMDHAYAAADLVLCRAGAITCSELLAAGRASILVPSPNVAEDHQTRNAESMVRNGASSLLPESGMADGWLAAVREMLENTAKRLEMADAARNASANDAAGLIAEDVLQIATRRAG